MSEPIDVIVLEAMRLPPDQRMALAHRILAGVEPAPATEIEALWDSEIRERIARYESGKAKGIPAAEAFADGDRRLRR